MTWANWTTYAKDVFDFFLSLFPAIFNLIMPTPLLGVPVILLIVTLILGTVVKFIGAIKSSNDES